MSSAAEKAKPKDVQLIITSCVVGYQGVNKRGEDYTIYEIGASRGDDGAPITDKKLRSFEELPVAPTPIELSVVPFKSDQHGLSFTLSRKGKAKGSTAQRVNEIQQQLTDVDERLKRVEAHLRGQASVPPEGVQPPTASQQDLDERYGAEAPY